MKFADWALSGLLLSVAAASGYASIKTTPSDSVVAVQQHKQGDIWWTLAIDFRDGRIVRIPDLRLGECYDRALELRESETQSFSCVRQ